LITINCRYQQQDIEIETLPEGWSGYARAFDLVGNIV